MSGLVLFVDDEADLEPLVLQRFRRQIRSGTLKFIFARDGVEALDVLDVTQGVDLVVVDINMPRMDGLTLLDRLQASHADLAAIIVSAYGDMSNIRTAMNRGAFDFLTKPIDFSDLEITIAKTIRHSQALRDARQRQAAAEQAFASLSRYFSPNLAARLAMGGEAPDLAGRRLDVAAVFTDIAGFTALAETVEPGDLGELLNAYLAGATAIVFAHEGTVAKVVGDALHILFGAPDDQPDHCDRAVACALELDQFAEGFRKTWRGRGIEIGPTRIGVHAGPAIVGNFGDQRFFDYTAYGDTINIAARLEQANKSLGTRICVSAAVAARAKDFVGRPVGQLLLRGRSDPLATFEPLSGDAFRQPATRAYLDSFALLETRDPGALPAFASLVGIRPDDALAHFHLKRLVNGANGIAIEV